MTQTVMAYLDRLILRYPVLQECREDASGCYSAVMALKEMNIRAEQSLISAEKFACMAYLLGLKHPLPRLEKAWKRLLLQHFHDTICGCSIRSACEDAVVAMSRAIDEAEECANDALQKIFWNIETLHEEIAPKGKNNFRVWESSRGTPLVVFNPHSFETIVPLSMPLQVSSVEDANGNSLPIQNIRAEYTTTAPLGKDVTLTVVRLPAMGYTVLRAYQNGKSKIPTARCSLQAWESGLENTWLRLEVDTNTGALVSLYDKAKNREILSAPARPRIMEENHCDTWCHAVFRFDQEIGVFTRAKIRLAEYGDVRAALEVKTYYEQSELTQKYILYRDIPGIMVEHEVFWHEKRKVLKLCYPLALQHGIVRAGIPYGFIQRAPNGREMPMQGFVALTEDDLGMGVAVNDRTAYDATENELRITALRSPAYADHFGHHDVDSIYTQQGEDRFTLYLCPVGEDLLSLKRQAQLLSCPPRYILGGDHHGHLPETASIATCDALNVDITVLKATEDGSGDLILRAHETAGKLQTSCCIALGKVKIQTNFGPQQIRTFRISDGNVFDVNMLEEKV